MPNLQAPVVPAPVVLPPLPSGGGGGGADKCKPGHLKIESETVATSPGPRSRTKIGVGEEVRIKVTGATGQVSWSVTGKSTLSFKAGPLVRLSAHESAETATVEVTDSCGCKLSLAFQVTEPSTVRMNRYPGSGIEHTKNRPDSGMYTEIYIGPDDVSFYNIEYQEVDVPAACTGVYTPFNGVGHDPNPTILGFSQDVVSGFGTKANAQDHVYSGDPGTAPPFAPGALTFMIPYQYRVGGGGMHRFATVEQESRLFPDGTTLGSIKAGAVVTCQLSDPTSSP